MRTRYALVAILVGVPLGWITFALVAEDDGVAAGVATGVATGLLTAAIAVGYVAWRDHVWATWAATLRARYDEGVVHDGQARLGRSIGIDVALVLFRAWHLLANSGIDGWLLLTTQRLVFHPRERGPNAVAIPVRDIAGVCRGTSAIPNTIVVRLRDQRSLEIRVRNRDEWLGRFAAIDGIKVLR